MTVDVAGKVRRPGIAVLDAGSRVVDALEAAGGARDGVDLTGLNLARVLVDGEQILVGLAAPTGVAATVTGGTSPVATLVNLNTADQVALESLPDVGPVTAQSILAWRSEHGAFTAVDQLLDVDGIGEVTLAKLTPYVTSDGRPTRPAAAAPRPGGVGRGAARAVAAGRRLGARPRRGRAVAGGRPLAGGGGGRPSPRWRCWPWPPGSGWWRWSGPRRCAWGRSRRPPSSAPW